MTSTNDDDRRLAEWLEDGPSRASERMIDAALAHAQAHPRRRDPLASFRKDPMTSNTIPAVGRPFTLLAAAALIVVAIFAAATVGGAFRGQPAVVVPTTTPSPTASPTPSPSAPSPAPTSVDIIETVGGDATATVTDGSGTLVSAISGQPGDGGSVENGVVQVGTLAADPNTIVLTWTDFPCASDYAVQIDATASNIAITGPLCGGDAIGVDRVLELTFDHEVDITSLVATITLFGEPTQSLGPSEPVHVDLITTVGPFVSATVTDRSGSLIGADSGQPRDGGSMPDGVVDLQGVVQDPFTIEVTWTDMPCGTDYDVTINEDLSTLVIHRGACNGDSIPVDRVLRLTFDHHFDTTGLTPTFVHE